MVILKVTKSWWISHFTWTHML